MGTTKNCNEADDFSDVIFTPHFRGERYLYHVCSGCNYQVQIDNDFYTKLYFGATFKFCPNCGKPVVRFTKIPVFEEEIKRGLFRVAEEIHKEFEDRLKYYLYIELDDDERRKLVDLAHFAIALEKEGGELAGAGAKMIAEYGYSKLSHWDKKKLKERVKHGLSKGQLD